MIKQLHSTDIILQIEPDFFIETVKVSQVSPHSHNFLELAYIAQGSVQHLVNDKVMELKKNDYIMIDYGTEHSFAQISDDLVIINCLFKPQLIDHCLTHSQSLSDLFNHYLINIGFPINHQPFIHHIFHDNDGAVLQLLTQLADEYHARSTGYLQVIRSLLINLFIFTMRKVQLLQQQQVTDSKHRIAEIMEIIDQDLLHPPTLQTIASSMNMHTSDLSRAFKLQSGYHFSTYIQIKRIEQACRLLSNTNKKVSEIANMCGYTDIKHFNQVFKQIMSATPTSYRKMVTS